MKHKLINYIILILLAVNTANLIAQVHTMYYLPVPQAHRLNPASTPSCDIFLGLPVGSSVYIESFNNSISLNDLFWRDPESNLILHPLHPGSDQSEFLAKFSKKNSFATDAYINILSFGFRVRSLYFTFNATSRLNESFSYPGDFMNFLIAGNSNGEVFDFSQFEMNTTEYIVYAVGVSRKFLGDQLSVGIKPKLITGVGTINSRNNNISLSTSYEEWVLNSQMEINMSLPGVTYPVNADGGLDLEGEWEIDSSLTNPSKWQTLLMGNIGLGIDIGAHFRPIDEVEVSLSVLDLGYIKWKNYTHTSFLDGSFTFDGVELSLSDTSANFLNDITDTIKSSLEFTGNNDPFKTYLAPKIYIGGRYFITKTLDVGILSRIDFTPAGTQANLMLLANYRPISMVGLSASYKPFGGTAQSFGVGASLRLGPVNIYLVSDYVPTSYKKVNNIPVPASQKYFNLRAGLNLVFGCNERKKLMRDKPMYYSTEY